MTDLDDAWDAMRAALPPGWVTGRPSYHPERREWLLYAYDPKKRPKVGLRSREWTAVARTEEEVVREMVRCLAELRQGRAPK